MAGKKLAANVWVNGTYHEAGSTPEKDVADQITNPKAWDAEEEEVVVVGAADADPGDGSGEAKPAKKATAKKSASRSS